MTGKVITTQLQTALHNVKTVAVRKLMEHRLVSASNKLRFQIFVMPMPMEFYIGTEGKPQLP